MIDVLPTQLTFGRVAVMPQLFCKWSNEDLDFVDLPTVDVVKTRWMRTCDTASDVPLGIALGAGEFREDPFVTSERPEVGCNVELTKVGTDHDTWWTFGAESFVLGRPGQTTELVARCLLQTMEALAGQSPVDLRAARYVGYADWLATK